MYGVEAQSVEMIVAGPEEDVAEDKTADAIRPGTVEIQRFAPGSEVGSGEIGTEGRHAVAFGAEVVINDVEENGYAFPVAGVDEPFQALRPAIVMLDREEEYAVVTPVAVAGAFGDGHQLDAGDAQGYQVIEAGDDGIEGPFGGERSTWIS